MFGLLGGQFGAMLPAAQGILGGMHQPIADNRNALMGMGAALMSGPMATAGPQIAEALQRGGLVDQRAMALRAEQLEAERKRQEGLAMAQKLGLDPVFANSPALLNQIAAQKYGPQEAKAKSLSDYLTPEEMRAAARRQYLGEGKTENMPNAPSGYRYKPDGTLEPIPGGPAGEGKPLTAEQGKSATFADRAEHSESVVSQFEHLGTNRTFRVHEQYSDQVESGRAGVIASGLNAAAAGLGAKVGQAALTPEQQRLRRAENDFLTAILRKESGAVIGATEFPQERVKYFPQPGDGPAVLADKREARRIAIEGLKREAGHARSSLGSGGTSRADLEAEARRRGLIP
jgi:hypothetical protein